MGDAQAESFSAGLLLTLRIMVTSWQLWLSGPRSERSNVAALPQVISAGGAIKAEFAVEEDGRHVVTETHYIDRELVRSGKSGPPLHIHLNQVETFQVVQGVLGVAVNGAEMALTKDDEPTSVPAGARHTFWCHKTCTEDLVFKVWVTPEDIDYGLDERFLRNFTSYLADCDKSKASPSLFQLLLFLYNAGIVLTPPFWVPQAVLKAIHHACAYWIGQRLLGYQVSYPEYYEERKAL